MTVNTIEKKLKDVKVEEMEIEIEIEIEIWSSHHAPLNLNNILTPKYQELSVLTLDLA